MADNPTQLSCEKEIILSGLLSSKGKCLGDECLAFSKNFGAKAYSK